MPNESKVVTTLNPNLFRSYQFGSSSLRMVKGGQDARDGGMEDISPRPESRTEVSDFDILIFDENIGKIFFPSTLHFEEVARLQIRHQQ